LVSAVWGSCVAAVRLISASRARGRDKGFSFGCNAWLRWLPDWAAGGRADLSFLLGCADGE